MINKKNIFYAFISIVISIFIAFIAYRIWEINFDVPPSFIDDGPVGVMAAISIEECGVKGAYFIDRLGAPEQADIIDFPFLDVNNILEMYLISLFVDSGSKLLYVFYFLSFPLACLTMFILLKRITDNAMLKAGISILFAILPYHFLRGFEHFTLSNFYIVPVGIMLSLLLFEETYDGLFPISFKSKKKRVLYFFACILVGLSNVYYAFISLICMFIALISKCISTNKIKCVIHEGLTLLLTLISVGIGLVPNIIFSMINGKNVQLTLRDPKESEFYSLKIIQLLLPCEYNRVSFLRKINELYTENGYSINENTMSSLGIAATIGFLLACILIIYRVISSNNVEFISNRVVKIGSFLSLCILALVLYSVAGGFGTIFSYYFISTFRCMNRTSVFIACLSLCILTLFVNCLIEKISIKKNIVITYSAFILLVCFAIYSEVPFKEKDYQSADIEKHSNYKEFFEKVELSLKPGDMVYTLPYLDFPEGHNYNLMLMYDPLYCYIYSHNTRWSYGAIKGRNNLGKALYIELGVTKPFLYGIKEYGFSGVYIDSYAYNDFGEAILTFYQDILGLTPIVSGDNRLYYFDITNVSLDENDKYSSLDYFINNFAVTCGVNLSYDLVHYIAQGVVINGSEQTELLYELIEKYEDNNVALSDDDYINFVYQTLLFRNPNVSEYEKALITLRNGKRLDILDLVLKSSEFKNMYGLYYDVD